MYHVRSNNEPASEAGNWTTAKVVQKNANNTRSLAYNYDPLQRLISSETGELDGSTISNTTRLQEWLLDNLGNWSGVDNSVQTGLRTTAYDSSGNVDSTRTQFHDTLLDNSIDSVKTTITGGSSSGAADDALIHDAAGNIVFDGDYLYWYDGWNRVVLVQDGGTLTAADFDANGELLSEPTGEPGSWTMRLLYDAYGRLVRRQTPVVASQDEIRQEDYRSDGLRRNQELVAREYALKLAPSGEGHRIEEPYFLDTFEPLFEWDIIQAQTVVSLQREYVPALRMRVRQTARAGPAETTRSAGQAFCGACGRS